MCLYLCHFPSSCKLHVGKVFQMVFSFFFVYCQRNNRCVNWYDCLCLKHFYSVNKMSEVRLIIINDSVNTLNFYQINFRMCTKKILFLIIMTTSPQSPHKWFKKCVCVCIVKLKMVTTLKQSVCDNMVFCCWLVGRCDIMHGRSA